MGKHVRSAASSKKPRANISKSVQKMGSKRKLSRFGKERNKGEAGINSAYVTRTQVLKRLQITLKDFRRLCILKGVYPRDPRKNLKSGKDKTYYHFKDVAHLSHEPLIDKFREFKAFMKKVRKTLGRRDPEKAKRLYLDAPSYTLHHLVKERYPKFEDALRDMDDALNLVHMFAALPAAGRVTSDRTRSCRELVAQWQFFLARSRRLGKCFVSVKGVYFQATLSGVPVTWIHPHEYTQHVPSDVDFRTMLTFLEFYETLIKFVLFKLFHAEGLRYPPAPGSDDDFALHGGLLTLRAEALDNKAKAETSAGCGGNMSENNEEDAGGSGSAKAILVNQAKDSAKAAVKRAKHVRKQLEHEVVSGGGEEDEEDKEGSAGEDVRKQLEEALVSATGLGGGGKGFLSGGGAPGLEEGDEWGAPGFGRRLFEGCAFFLSRESQYSWLEFAMRSFGGTVGWHGSATFGESDTAVTHVVYDRPTAPQATRTDVEYVQPQWVLDSINVGVRLPMDRYRPGGSLPPHLSPFVDDAKEGYVPAYREELDALKSAAEEYGQSGSRGGVAELTEGKVEEGADERGDDDDDDDDDDDEREEDGEEDEEGDDGGGESGEEDKPKTPAEEEKELALVMMSKKARRLYGKMQHGIAKQSGKVGDLKRKRAAAKATVEMGNK